MLLEIEHLSKTYRKGVQANQDISLSIDAGEVFGLLGPNGAGKTTLVRQVLGSIVPTEGSITIDGVDVIRRPAFARRACSYQPQSSVPIDALTPMEAIAIAGRIRGGSRPAVEARAQELIEALDLGPWARKHVPLSGGVARLVAFCMAAVVPGRIVVLDEPTNDVDPLRWKLLWQRVRELADRGSAVLLVTHNVLEAERCVDRLAIIDGGRVRSSGTAGTMKADFGGWLRLEVVLEPDSVSPEQPAFLRAPALSGRRLIAEIAAADVGLAVEWASDLRRQGLAEEFAIGPISLEDVYVRQVTASSVNGKVA
ncbi:MAG TPA: ABC transporter ATP-binding protein [Actinomycetota bacterium]|nr:ABC transporter ATP-binding protein [Actinomycetota bacterium]